MKIVQINATYGVGSTGIITHDILQSCRDAGIDCVIASPKNVSNVTYGYKIGNLISNKIHALLSRISGKQGYYSFFSTWKFLHFLDEYKPDILHLHNLHACYINIPMLLKYAAKHDIAVVATLHDCWFYTGGCTHYTSANCSKWKDECGHCPRRYDDVNAIAIDGTKRILKDRVKLFGEVKNLTVVGVSQWITDEASVKVFKNARCISIHNGIDTVFFKPIQSNFRKKFSLEGKFVILAPANKWFLPINKQTLDYFASHMTDDMMMVFIGNGTINAPLPKNMIHLGFISSREEIRGIYSAVDVMVNCTREESLSLLNVEVQACGTPVITYSNTGVKETVDGKCGFAVENGNPEEAWNAMMRVKECGKLQFSSHCVEWVNKTYNKNHNYQKYVELYNTIIQ